jgi:hypothetical protein
MEDVDAAMDVDAVAMDADAVAMDADAVVMDADTDEEMPHEVEATEGAVDAAMVPVIPTLVSLKDAPPISSLHRHPSSRFFQVLLLMQLLLLLLLLHPWYHRTPLLAQLVPRNVLSLPGCSIVQRLQTRRCNKHSSLTR